MRRADEAPEPSIEIDVDSKYIVELLELVEGPSQWADAKEGDVSLTWKFRLFDQASGQPVIDLNNGFAYELWQFSNDKTYRNVKSGKAAKAREWAEALVGKGELTDDQVNELIDFGFAEALKGKRGLADLEWYTTAKGFERLKIIRLRPLKKQPRTVSEGAEEGERMAVAAEQARAKLTAAADADDGVRYNQDGNEVPAKKVARTARQDDADAAKAAARKLLGLDEAA